MKLFISLSRNIYNQDELNSVLASLKTDNDGINKWISSNLRNYLINKYEGVTSVKKSKKTDPDWVKNSILKQELFKINTSGNTWRAFLTNIEHAIGYLRTVRDPSRVSVEDAIASGNKLIELEIKNASDKEDLEGLELLYEFPDKFRWVNLLSEQNLQREGKLMQHCVGSERMGYIKRVARKQLEIWSLRDPQNNPHCTIEFNPKFKRVEQISGKQNEGVIKKYTPYVEKFLKGLLKEGKIKKIEDLYNLGVLEQDGEWYDVYNLPENFTVKREFHPPDDITFLPNNLTVAKSLYIIDTKISVLPENLKVRGTLMVNEFITTVPSSLKVGSLILRYSKVTSLPDNFTVKKLVLTDSKVEKLPNNLKVGSTLDLRKTKIDVIPESLYVRGNLILNRNIKLSDVPKSAKIIGEVLPMNASEARIRAKLMSLLR